jgi:hypothetical protein
MLDGIPLHIMSKNSMKKRDKSHRPSQFGHCVTSAAQIQSGAELRIPRFSREARAGATVETERHRDKEITKQVLPNVRR